MVFYVTRDNISMPNKKRVLITISSLTGGGAEHVVEHLCELLGVKYEVICGYYKECGERGEALKEKGIKVVKIKNSGRKNRNYLNFLDLRKFVKEYNIDLIHAHDIHSMMNASQVKLLMPKVKVVYTFHFGNYPNIDKKIYYFEKLFTKFIDVLIAVGTKQANAIRDTYNYPADRLQVIYNGVQAVDAQPAEFEQQGQDRPILFGSLSTLIEQKGIPVLIDAVEILERRHPGRSKFIIAGDGYMMDELLQLCEQKNLSEIIEFAGWVRNADINLLPKFDVFVQSSKWEAMSMVILEAMSAGKPIVATEVGENGVVIEHDSCGLIVPPNQAEMLADALERLLLDSKLRRTFGENAKQRFAKNFTVQQMAHNYDKLYNSMMES
ncbi:MAG: glycosyltransferase family 4 protein [Candidatus Thiodiazotropha taylori]|nr:glycosyltransferase family 4 protein [Candidatus Thiodiazotropha taylori]